MKIDVSLTLSSRVARRALHVSFQANALSAWCLSCSEPHSHTEDHGHSHKSKEASDHGHSHGM